jgi:2'-5' RNA ligase superfamily
LPYAVEMYFDQTADATLRGLWQAMTHAGIRTGMIESGQRPHVTLAVYDTLVDDGWFLATLEEFAGVTAPLALTLGTIGIFPTSEAVLYLGVTMTGALYDLHTAYHTWFSDYKSGLRSYYAPNFWIPHSTIGYGLSLESMFAAIQCCAAFTFPITAHVQGLGLVEVTAEACHVIADIPIGTLD